MADYHNTECVKKTVLGDDMIVNSRFYLFYISFSLIILLVFPFPSWAFSPERQADGIMHTFDADGDGRILNAERSAWRDVRFRAMDADHSGFLDRAEWALGYRSGADYLWAHPVGEDRRRSHHIWLYRSIDLNQDGLIGWAEFMSYQDGMDFFDLDADAAITRAELVSVFSAAAERPRICDHREEK